MCFIPLAFHPENTELSDLPGPTGFDDLMTVAVSRLMLDNFDHIKAYWIMLTPRIAQTSANGTTRRELGFSEAAVAGLTALGHSLRSPGEIGSVQAVVVDRRGQRQFGAADKRRIGGVVSLRRAQSAAD